MYATNKKEDNTIPKSYSEKSEAENGHRKRQRDGK